MANSNYEKVALIYDHLMQAVDYQAWADYMEDIIRRLTIKPRRILDLACGTGGGTLPLAARGYQVLGLDISREMLGLAAKKAREAGLQITLLQEDMRAFSLPEPVHMAVIFQEGLNYLLEPEDVRKTFGCVYRALSPGGVFAFDLHLLPGLPQSAGEASMVEEENFTLFWESAYLPADALWQISLTGFLKGEGGLYERFQETHRERYYSPGEITRLLKETGFAVEGVYRAFTFERDPHARRLYVVAQKAGKGGGP